MRWRGQRRTTHGSVAAKEKVANTLKEKVAKTLKEKVVKTLKEKAAKTLKEKVAKTSILKKNTNHYANTPKKNTSKQNHIKNYFLIFITKSK